MDRKLFVGIFLFTLIAISLAILLPGGKPVDKNPKLPWMIEISPTGASSVFGLTLGESSLADAREIFQAQGKSNLFRSANGTLAVEAYFQRLFLSGIRADIVLTLEIDQQHAQEIFDRGLRISQMGSGGKKIDLSGDDLDRVAALKIRHITYIPAANLDAALISGRFGQPKSVIKESEKEIEHWFYPEKGLDVALNPDGKEVFQYITPADFALIAQPLLKQ